jgi:hypothetical protein
MSQVTVTKGDQVRVVPAELADRYRSRGWEQIDSRQPPPATPEPPTDLRPAKSARVEDWRAYAINTLGLPSHEVGSLTKDELIEKAGI